MSKSNEIELKCHLNTAEVITYLESLVESFKAGQVVVTHGEQSLVLNPPEQVAVEVEARQKKDKCKFVLELSWRMPAAVESPENFSISPQVPEPEDTTEEHGRDESAAPDTPQADAARDVSDITDADAGPTPDGTEGPAAPELQPSESGTFPSRSRF